MHQIDQQLALRPIYPTGGAAHSAHLDPLAGKGEGEKGRKGGEKKTGKRKKGKERKGRGDCIFLNLSLASILSRMYVMCVCREFACRFRRVK